MNELTLDGRGRYIELKKLPNPHALHLVIVPSLVEQFMQAEERLGRELTRAETEKIRDNSTAVVVDEAMVNQLAYDRHYIEVDPEVPYESWRAQRDDDAWRGSYEQD